MCVHHRLIHACTRPAGLISAVSIASQVLGSISALLRHSLQMLLSAPVLICAWRVALPASLAVLLHLGFEAPCGVCQAASLVA